MPRPRGYLADYRPKSKTVALLEQVGNVFAVYREQLPLTARQVFYALVGGHEYPKDEQAYDRLLDALGNARRARLVPFDHVRDDGTIKAAPLEFASPEAFLAYVEDLAARSQSVRQEGQARRVELWCEAGGMAPQLGRVVGEYGVAVYSSGGFDSLTMKFEAAQRIAARDVPTLVLHVGDFDPSGVTMFQAAMEDVEAFVEADGGVGVEFERLALTRAQVARYNLPGAPPKRSSHGSRWRDGEDAVQLEAMPPDLLAAEIRQAVKRELDLGVFERARSQESANLAEIMRRLRGEDRVRPRR